MDYTPTGRPSTFDVPGYEDIADLHVLFKRFADTALAGRGDKASGNYQFTGNVTVDGSLTAGGLDVTSSPAIRRTGAFTPTQAEVKARTTFFVDSASTVLVTAPATTGLSDGARFAVVQQGAGLVQLTGATVTGATTTDGQFQRLEVMLINGSWVAIEGIRGPVGPEGPSPDGGSKGQVLAKLSSADGDIGWVNPSGLPTGGVAGEVLMKNSSTDGDATWVTAGEVPGGGGGIGSGTGLPVGGTTGQALVKTSDTDYDVEWATVSGGAGGGATYLGTVQTVSSDATNATVEITHGGIGSVSARNVTGRSFAPSDEVVLAPVLGDATYGYAILGVAVRNSTGGGGTLGPTTPAAGYPKAQNQGGYTLAAAGTNVVIGNIGNGLGRGFIYDATFRGFDNPAAAGSVTFPNLSGEATYFMYENYLCGIMRNTSAQTGLYRWNQATSAWVPFANGVLAASSSSNIGAWTGDASADRFHTNYNGMQYSAYAVIGNVIWLASMSYSTASASSATIKVYLASYTYAGSDPFAGTMNLYLDGDTFTVPLAANPTYSNVGNQSTATSVSFSTDYAIFQPVDNTDSTTSISGWLRVKLSDGTVTTGTASGLARVMGTASLLDDSAMCMHEANGSNAVVLKVVRGSVDGTAEEWDTTLRALGGTTLATATEWATVNGQGLYVVPSSSGGSSGSWEPSLIRRAVGTSFARTSQFLDLDGFLWAPYLYLKPGWSSTGSTFDLEVHVLRFAPGGTYKNELTIPLGTGCTYAGAAVTSPALVMDFAGSMRLHMFLSNSQQAPSDRTVMMSLPGAGSNEAASSSPGATMAGRYLHIFNY